MVLAGAGSAYAAALVDRVAEPEGVATLVFCRGCSALINRKVRRLEWPPPPTSTWPLTDDSAAELAEQALRRVGGLIDTTHRQGIPLVVRGVARNQTINGIVPICLEFVEGGTHDGLSLRVRVALVVTGDGLEQRLEDPPVRACLPGVGGCFLWMGARPVGRSRRAE